MKTNHYLILLFLLVVASCRVAEKEKAPITPLFQVGDTPVSSDDFLYVYEKNNYNNKEISSRDEIREYLDLYINFKLKIKEAEELGLNKSEAFNQELEGYRKQLARPYLTESQVTDSLVEEAYQRMKEEIKASHILISVNQDASPSDTLEAYEKIESIRKRALKEGNFNKLAKEYSDDPSAENNGGELGYFTALQMVYPFEDAAYKTPVGQISQPVRTRFGYHIIKITDRRPSRGKIQVSHIMIRATEGISAEDSISARNKIYEIHNKLLSGGNWMELAKQFSDDINTRNQGGKLPWFGTGNMIPEFEEAAYNLTSENDFSEPIKTVYGWHIIKLEGKKDLETFEELSAGIKAKVAKDSRSELNKIALIKRLKKENNVKEYPEVLADIIRNSDSTAIKSEKAMQQNDKLLKSTLFSIEDTAFTVQQFFIFQNKNQNPFNATTSVANNINQTYNKFLEDMLLQYEENNLEKKYNDFRIIVNEYREGILLFQLMDEKVWSKAISDTLGLKEFFENNRDNYRWKERLDAKIYNVADENILNKIKPLLSAEFISLPGETVSFNVPKNKPDLSEQEKAVLNNLSEKLNQNEDFLLKITGRSSISGKEKIDKRLELIFNLLENKGIDRDKIIVDHQQAATASFTFELGGHQKQILEKIFNKDQPLSLQIEEGPFERGYRPILEEIPWDPGAYTIKKDDRVYYIEVNKVLPPALKELNEVRGMVISDYQNFLEKEWIQTLKNKYTVQVNEDSLEKIYQKFENN